MSWIKRIVFFLIVFLFLISLALFVYLTNDAKVPYDIPDPIPVIVPTFTEVEIDFKHNFYAKDHLPFMGAGIIDVDGDNVPELWLGGGKDQQDGLFKYENGKFENIASQWGLNEKPSEHHSYGPAMYDIDNDGDEDILVCRPDDVYIYYNQGSNFDPAIPLNVPLNNKSVPISITLGDVDRDGNIDLFVSAYITRDSVQGQTIFTNKTYGASSLLLRNNGNGVFEDITATSGLSYIHNTFVATFIDVDDDTIIDLIVSHDTGEVRTYKNNGQGHFTMVANPLTNHYAYPMSLGVGDYNNDSRPDFFFSNVGTTMPRAILKGDLDKEEEKRFVMEWLLFRNDGGFSFSEVGEETHLAKYEFGWGAIFEDWNLDGLQDLAVAENYVDLPNFKLVKLPCRFLLNIPANQFVATGQQAGVTNENYAISPLTADFNNDGYPDLVYSNISGKSRAWINDGGGQGFLKVKLEQTPRALGAKIQVIKTSGQTLTDWLIVGEGLSSDQSHTAVFGINPGENVELLRVNYSDGASYTLESPATNQTLTIADSLAVHIAETE